MAEPFSVAVGILSIIKAAKTVYVISKSVKNAQKELEPLLKELAVVEKVVERIRERCYDTSATNSSARSTTLNEFPSELTPMLQKAKKKIEEVNEFVEYKLINDRSITESQPGEPATEKKIKRGSLAIRLRTVQGLKKELNEVKRELEEAVTVLDSYVLQNIQRVVATFDKRVEQIPVAIEDQNRQYWAELFGFLKRAFESPTAWQSRRPEQVEQSKTERNCMRVTKTLVSVTPSSAKKLRLRKSFDISVESDSDSWSTVTSHFDRDEMERMGDLLQDSSSRLNLADFEMSGSWYPEQYTQQSKVPKFLSACFHTDIPGTDKSLKEWHVWWSDSPRRWRMIRITSMTEDLVVDEKKLQEKWTPQYMWVPPIVLNLPCNTQLIEEYCAENNIMSADVVNLRLQHQEGGSSALVKSESKPYEPEGMEMGALYRSAQFLMDVQDLGCPIIPEREIIVHEILSGFTTKVVFEGKICIEKKLPLAPFHLEPFLYEMKALYQLRECPGIVEFIGVDVDNKRNTLQGYLRACEEYDLSTVLRKGTSRENHIPWSVRERWAGQIIDGIYNAHLKGIVIGTLDVNEIGVDDDHNAKLLHVGHGKCLLKSGCLAPELRPRVDHSDARMRLTDAHMNARQDVFALGLVLWILAQTRLKEKVILDTRTVGRKAWWKRQFCIISKCPFGNEDLENNHCQQIHADPIDLPLCSRDIPVYYRELIARCRATSPQLRATAREVKQLFGIGIRRSAVKSTEKSIAKRRKDSVISDTST